MDGENLAARALAALRARGWDGPPVRITIEKRIPVAAGMAGGSADAAAALRLAMAVAPGRAEEVDQIAVELGADVPSQLLPGVRSGPGPGRSSSTSSRWRSTRSWCCRRSSRCRPPTCSARPTGWVCSARTRSSTGSTSELVAALAPDPELPRRLLVNDLEPAAMSLCPWCGDALEALRAAGRRARDGVRFRADGCGDLVGLGRRGTGVLRPPQETACSSTRSAVGAEPVTAEYAAPSLT